METEARWSDQIPEKDGSKLSVFEVAISPGNANRDALDALRINITFFA